MHVGFWVATMLTEMISSKGMGFGSSITKMTRKLNEFPVWGFLECSFPEEDFTPPFEFDILSFQALLHEGTNITTLEGVDAEPDDLDEHEEPRST